MEMENLTFPEAVRALGREVGIEIAEERGGDRGQVERLIAANAVAQECYRAELQVSGNPGAAYLTKRGIDAEMCERFGLGFAPDRWDTVEQALRSRKIPAADGVAAGLLAERDSGGHYDRFRGRVTFPIHDVRGRVIGFGGRAIGADQEPKYLNTPETPIFHKREAFYGFPGALEAMRRNGRSVVVEGYFDRIALHRAGVEESVATCGTALTDFHAKNLQRRARDVVLLFDGDAAGVRAVERALEVLLPHELRVRAVALPEGDDPDEFLVREGPDALRALVDSAQPALDIVISRAVAKGCATPWQKADVVEALAPLLALIPSAVERGEYCAQVALAVGSEAHNVEAAIRRTQRGEDAREEIPVEPKRRGPEERNVLQLVRSLLEHPQHAQRISLDELTALVTDRPLADLVRALVEAARSDEPLDVERIAEGLGAEAGNRLRELAAGESLPEDSARRTIDDTIRWLRRRRNREEARELTAKLRDPDSDHDALLTAKTKRSKEYA
jgi:DNA primase